MTKKIYHINDKTMKYKAAILNKRQHEYLELPGTFEARYPQEIVFPNMDAGRADEFYSTKENLMINLEEESEAITDATLKKISNYVIFAEFMYSKRLYSAVICHKDPGKDVEYYERSPSVIIKIHYIYMLQEEIWEKYENLINKIRQKEKLTERELLDMAFVPKFISKENGQYVTESLAKAYNYAIIEDRMLRIHIGIILEAMILKHFENEKKILDLMDVINMGQIDNELKLLAREEFREEFEKIEKEKQELEMENFKMKKENNEIKKENNHMKKENGKLKRNIEKLSKMDDLNTPEAKKLINSMIVF